MCPGSSSWAQQVVIEGIATKLAIAPFSNDDRHCKWHEQTLLCARCYSKHFAHQLFSITLWGRSDYYPHFRGEKTKIKRGEETWQRLLGTGEAEIRLEVVWSRTGPLNHWAILKFISVSAKEFGGTDPIQRTLSFDLLNETPKRIISYACHSALPVGSQR